MKLKLEALSPAEGIGIVRADQKLRLIRPPYSSSDAPVLPEESLQDAVTRHGFSASAEAFASWADVITYLNQQVAAVRRSLGTEIPDSIPGGAILDVAPIEILEHFLDRVEREIIPQRLFDHAEDFLFAILASNAPTRYPEIRSRVVGLLQRNRDARKQSEDRQTELANRDVRFAGLQRRGELEWSARLAEAIRERGCVFA